MLKDTELRLEEQDLRLLKTILTDPLSGIEFANTYDEKIFLGDSKWFAQSVLAYIKAYKTLPTKRVMLEHFQHSSQKQDNVATIWDSIFELEANPSEFKYDLDKLKNRFGEQRKQKLKDLLNSDLELEPLIKLVKDEVGVIEQVKKGQKQIYTQKTLKSYLSEFKQSYNDKYHNKELGRGILTGYSFLDYAKNGLMPSELMIIGGESGGGKMLPLDTPILTPTGFKTMKDIHPGDKIFGQDGKAYSVVAESEIRTEPGYKFIFNDHTEIISYDEHLWLTLDRKEQKDFYQHSSSKASFGTVRSTKEIVETLHSGHRNNHAIPLCESIRFSKKKLLIDPYVLGAWLGDGSKNDGMITSADEEIISLIESKGYVLSKKTSKYRQDGTLDRSSSYRFKGLRSQLRLIKVFKNKHIPQNYLFGAKEQRLALLQGLMDTDGYVSKRGYIEFVNTNKTLIDGIGFLINSLGEKCTITEGQAKLYGRVTGPKWSVRFCPSFPAFKLQRKLSRQKTTTKLHKFRYIVKAERVEAVPMKCIQVSSPDHLYLCGKNLIPTHNSMLLNNMAIQMWMQNNTVFTPSDSFCKGYNVLYFSLEMPYEACARRTFARLADVPMYGIRDSCLNKFQLKGLHKALEFIDRYPYEFEIVDIPRGVTVDQIESRFQEACSRYHPDIIVVDYLGLLEDHGAEGDDWLKLGYIAGKLHELARAYNIVMLTAVQLNRASNKSKQDPSELIGMHRIGRSSLIMHHANIALQIESRKDEHTFSDLRYHIIKNRDGELGMHVLMKNFAHASVKDMDPPFEPKKDEYGTILNREDVEDISELLKQHNWGRRVII